MRRSVVLGVVLAVVCGCGALVGVKELEVDATATSDDRDGGSPIVEDGGADKPTDAGSSGVITDGPNDPPPPEKPPRRTYTYSVDGGDELKGPFTDKSTYTASPTVEITDDGAACFNEKFHIRKDYDETLHLCLRDDGYFQDTGTRAQYFTISFARVGATTQVLCNPGDNYFPRRLQVGAELPHTCEGANIDGKTDSSKFTTAGFFRFDGMETLNLGGTAVEVLRFHHDRTVTRAQTGKNIADWWIARNGAIVRLKRTIDIKYGTSFGVVNYLESLDMTLTGLP